jgi:glycosyltransferase involved in cell wall biosynthesis
MHQPKLSILIPVRDETLNLYVMLKILKSVMDDSCEILVIFDSEDDNGVQVVNDFIKFHSKIRAIFNKLGRGVANALREGVANATGKYVLIFAADEIGPVLAIEDMINLMDEGCGLVSCTRYAHGGRRLGGSFIGYILSYLANKMLRTCTKVRLSDSTTGIKIFRRTDFNLLCHDSSSVGWVIAFEMAINAQILEMKLGEVPIISIDRLFGGKSTFKVIPWVRAYMKYFILAFKKLPPWKTTTEVSLQVKLPLNLYIDS